MQVVEAVTVLEVSQLCLKDEVECRAQRSTEQFLAFGKATDPEVDLVETGGGATVKTRPPSIAHAPEEI